MFGVDSRAAMVPGGAAQGFGNLGAALLLAPHLAQQRQDQADRDARAAQLADEDRQFRDRQLAQSLQIAQMQDANERARIHDSWQGEQDNKAYRDSQTALAASNNARDWAGTIGTGVMNLGKALGITQGGGAGHEFKPMEIDPYKTVETADPETGKVIRTRVLKTEDEAQQELHMRGLLKGAINGKAPATSEVIQDRNKRNAQVRANQQAGGLAQAPGQKAPPPSTAGVNEVMPSSQATPPPVTTPTAPAAAPGPVTTAHAPTLTKAHLMSRVADGTFPDFNSAYQDATSRGYNIQDM